MFWNRSCWLELSELCVTGKHSPPSWQQIDPTKSIHRTIDLKRGNRSENRDENKIKTRVSNLNLMSNDSEDIKDGNDARICYLCFLTHYYLELQQGENAIKILEGVLQVFPNSLIATSQVQCAIHFHPLIFLINSLLSSYLMSLFLSKCFKYIVTMIA